MDLPFYADDTLSFKKKVQSLSPTDNCLTGIEGWIRTNILKLNSNKIDIILFTSIHNALHVENVTVCVGDFNITSVNAVSNLGLIFHSA